ncbi:hypothetical protein UlMin_025238 [Ulmus minor]
MNTITTDIASIAPPPESSSDMSGTTYIIIFTLGIIILTVLVTLACCYLCKINFSPPDPILSQSSPSSPIATNTTTTTNIKQTELDKGIIGTYPEILYSEAKLQYGSSTASCCSICLGDYKDNDMLLLLQDCSHLYHVKCVNQWFQLHLTCPMCRKSPLPASVLVPVTENEMTPLPAQEDGLERQSYVQDIDGV